MPEYSKHTDQLLQFVVDNQIKIIKGESEFLKLENLQNFNVLVEKNKRNNIKYEIKLPKEINAPIKKGDKEMKHSEMIAKKMP